jgi:uncharacterized membrane-anchored protein
MRSVAPTFVHAATHVAVTLSLVLSSFTALYAADEAQPSRAHEFHPQTGKIIIGDNLATIDVPDDMIFYNAKDARYLLEEQWHNPPDPSVLGAIIKPGDENVRESNDVVIVVSYDDCGHVSDSDATSLDYQELLSNMQSECRDVNPQRRKQGYDGVELLGWSEPPHYDSSNKKIYWAKSLKFDSAPEPTLNYCVRVLGRKGVLELNAIGDVKDLANVAPVAQATLAKVEFNAGQRYTDFDESSDPVSAGGIAALIAGGFAAKKLGFFALIGVFFLKFFKVLIVPIILIGAWVAKRFSRGESKTQEQIT